jgi:hypothetical protein
MLAVRWLEWGRVSRSTRSVDALEIAWLRAGSSVFGTSGHDAARNAEGHRLRPRRFGYGSFLTFGPHLLIPIRSALLLCNIEVKV